MENLINILGMEYISSPVFWAGVFLFLYGFNYAIRKANAPDMLTRYTGPLLVLVGFMLMHLEITGVLLSIIGG